MKTAKDSSSGKKDSTSQPGGDSRYPVPDLKPGEFHRTEFTVKRSRFITSIGRTADVDAARSFIASISLEFKDARHNCFAFNAGAPLSTAFVGCSDAGEPKGTAGQPMLKVLLHSGVGQLTAVVTRYFGGILLGTGGLVKAYQDGVRQGLETLRTRELIIPAIIELELAHRFVGAFMQLMEPFEIAIEKSEFAELARYRLALPKEHAENFMARITDLSGGSAIVKII